MLIVDDAERLPNATHALIQYLFLNAPANFRLIIGSRKPLSLETTELAAKGYLAILPSENLRLRLEESLQILGRRLGRRVDVNDQAHLHEITQGCPIGLQHGDRSQVGQPCRSRSFTMPHSLIRPRNQVAFPAWA